MDATTTPTPTTIRMCANCAFWSQTKVNEDYENAELPIAGRCNPTATQDHVPMVLTWPVYAHSDEGGLAVMATAPTFSCSQFQESAGD